MQLYITISPAPTDTYICFVLDSRHLHSYLYILGLHDWFNFVRGRGHCELLGKQGHRSAHRRSASLV